MTSPTIVDADFALTLPGGKTLTGSLEYFAEPHVLVLMSQEQPTPIVLTVTASEAPVEHAALESDQVLIRNWVETRGVAEQLAATGVLALTGETVSVGLFNLEALVARMR